MIRASVLRSSFAILIALAIIGVDLVPVVANAQASNICIAADNKCASDSNVGDPCVCAITGVYITGICAAKTKCKGQFVISSSGVKTALGDLPNSTLEGWGLQSADGSSGVMGWLQKNPLLGGLAIGAGTSLLSSLLSSALSPSQNTDTSATTPTGCTTQYYYTSDPNALADPCAIYNPSNTTTTNPATTTDNGLSALLSGLQSPTINITVPTTSATLPDIINTIPSSTVPLTPAYPQVTIPSTVAPITPAQVPATPTSDITPIATTSPIALSTNPGDISSEGQPDLSGDDTTPQDVVPITETLTSTYYYDDTSGDTPTASSTPLNQNPVPVPTGLHGDISTFGGGATIYANNRTANSETAGFFGTGSTVANLCAARPWATNFLSYVIPPTFFDSLCSLAGYGGGGASPSGGGSGGMQGTTNVSVAAPATQTAATTTNPYAPVATIWARPTSVSIGGRTTIFWTSQNVTACTESSSDGNFSGSSTSGGASTVALSGPVTFTIQCRGADGSMISNSTTVTIGI